ncbi:MAG: 16S rRNA (cytosine(1402)-N(4))-methyltransferase RsmH [Calditrichaeota bacterium]|nr:16S rRNA (cytosine(1402)-N(4))-methyltransferase RsmH [Calditrichota bacterium]MCB0303645.1 16S rRNA (cytosine(1402)-N(4))-methyltransferase RsmH [Calditrichota bacterium]MCB9087687.1 16S rRNA (cytosine(1402)-N(4))-methyltransferase RsmH [Calditrichia bacterium]
MKDGFHRPVLEEQAVQYLIVHPEGIYVDCTVGGGGHSLAILQSTTPRAFLVGLDADPEAIEHAGQVLAAYPNKLLRQIFYDQLELVLYESGRYPVSGVLYDLGISSHQIDETRRGFSFQGDGPLDMRFDPRQQQGAAEILNGYDRKELERVIREYGEERHWRAIARDIVARRQLQPFHNARDLSEVVRQVVGERFLNKSLARVWQALRIEVNQELARLTRSLEAAFAMLEQGGRMVVISYHSLEDRIVKNFMREKSRDCICPPELPACMCDKVSELKILTRKPLQPDAAEVRRNSRSRSARLRAAEKIVPYQGGKA